MKQLSHIAICLGFSFVCFPMAVSAQTETLQKAKTALADGQTMKALALVQKELRVNPASVAGWLLLGDIEEKRERYASTVSAIRKVLELDPTRVEAYQRLGVAYFKNGQFAESSSAFDRYIKLNPAFKARHWQRGISYYYAKRYKDGKEQFEGYQTFDSNDVENAVWRYLCMVPLVGAKKSRADMLKIGNDRRVPMRQIYDLFSGKLKPKDILAAAKSGKPNAEQLNSRLFYTHLYLGLYQAAAGNEKKALEHLHTATEQHRIGHYMWDVARVHRDLLKKKLGN